LTQVSTILASPDAGLASLQLFREEVHQPFFLEGGRPTAVLVHGFLGTPAELRPLAAKLHQVGWTARGLLLPGFGVGIDTLFTRQWTEWIATVRQAVDQLKRQERPVLLVGYSLGAAISLKVAATTEVDGLVLLAPFWKFGTPAQRLIWGAMKRIFPRFQPFRRANFSDPRFRSFFEKTIPMLDLDDPDAQATIRRMEVPSRFVDEIVAVGKSAAVSAPKIRLRTGVVQGLEDESVKPEYTWELVRRLGGPVIYEEITADHGLVEPDNPGFDWMVRFVLSYAAGVLKA
jgi:carboxylesterase